MLLTGWGTPSLQEAWLAGAPKLRLICHCAGSTRGIVPPSVFERGIMLCHAAPMIADAVAEFCIAAELLWLRRIAQVADNLKQTGRWGANKELGTLQGHLLSAQVVGVVGSGYVARRHIRLLQAFGAHVHVDDPFLSVETAAELGVEKVSLEQVFGESSVIAVHVPKTPDTHHIIGAELLRRIQPGAILIQTSRSWVLDEQALLAELQTGRFYAAIDVFDQEPQPPDSPFYQLENVLATPHIAGASVESMAHQGYDMALEVQRFGRGEPLRFAIAAERYHLMA